MANARPLEKELIQAISKRYSDPAPTKPEDQPDENACLQEDTGADVIVQAMPRNVVDHPLQLPQ